ncbi:MAG: zf-HC2 domain-containing protein [Deltaproteobacteria bacterium]|nr:zf-HC2 domain-containing protein [Deltaproteobacteria bacterium]
MPAYPDGDLPSFWRARIRSHLQGCPACREELAGLEEVVRTIKAAALPAPEPAFWEAFNRDLHLKLAQSAPAPQPSRFSKMPYYLVGAPALAVLLLWVAIGYLKPERPVTAPPPQMAEQLKAPEKMASTPRVMAPAPETTGSIALVTQNGDEMPPDDDLDLLRGDLDSTLAGMTEKEREAFLKRVRQHEKDGSCTRKYSAIFWA